MQFHGDAWEFLRNDAMDAANYFNPIKTPLKQNQFGVGVGGPVLLPHYNGHDERFSTHRTRDTGTTRHRAIFIARQRQRNWVATSAISTAQGIQLYNPFSSVPQVAVGVAKCDWIRLCSRSCAMHRAIRCRRTEAASSQDRKSVQ